MVATARQTPMQRQKLTLRLGKSVDLTMCSPRNQSGLSCNGINGYIHVTVSLLHESSPQLIGASESVSTVRAGRTTLCLPQKRVRLPPRAPLVRRSAYPMTMDSIVGNWRGKATGGISTTRFHGTDKLIVDASS